MAQQAAPQGGAAQKYKLTVLENASTSKRTKKGRASSQAVVMVTDSNNVPVPGITVTFLLPQTGTSGAAFGNGALSAVVTTNSAGVASSGTISATAGSSFSVGVSAATPGGILTASAPIASAAAATGAGVSTGLLVGIGAAVAGAAVVVATTVLKKSSSNPTTTTPTGTIGAPGTVTFGH